MKKVALLAAILCVSTAVFAEEKTAPKEGQKTAVEHFRGPGHEAFAKAHKEQMAKMKATHKKMEKLVKEYKALKDDKKKDAKRTEIEKEVMSIREEQIKFKQNQLGEFEKRLDHMKKEFAKQNTPDGKKEWVNQKTEALIEKGGDLKVLFDRPQGPEMEGRRGPHGPKDHHGPRFGRTKEMREHNQKPPVDELPVERPVKK